MTLAPGAPRFVVRRVLARLRTGSSSPVVVDTAAGRFVAKLRGAAQGPLALIAEVIVAELAERLLLPVPERVCLLLPAGVESADRNDELADLLAASSGENLGFRWLPSASVIDASELPRVADDFALRVLWLDGLVMNLDRTPSNPNVLMAQGQPWLIDHGASLVFQYDWATVNEQSPRAPVDHGAHLFGARRERLAHWDAELAAALPRAALEEVLSRVPESFLASGPAEWPPERARAAYVAFLWKRLRAPRPFV